MRCLWVSLISQLCIFEAISRRHACTSYAPSTESYWEMNSFSESQALKLAMSCGEEFVNHNKKFLSRIYPNGMRIDSSNYNPQDLWNCGCQMVRCT